jgi:hypothetical protein
LSIDSQDVSNLATWGEMLRLAAEKVPDCCADGQADDPLP